MRYRHAERYVHDQILNTKQKLTTPLKCKSVACGQLGGGGASEYIELLSSFCGLLCQVYSGFTLMSLAIIGRQQLAMGWHSIPVTRSIKPFGHCARNLSLVPLVLAASKPALVSCWQRKVLT